MGRDEGVTVVVSLADLFAARQPDRSPLSPATGLDLPHLTRTADPEPETEPESSAEPEPQPVEPVVRISPAYALRPLSDALCAGCGQPRHSTSPHQHAPGSSLDD